MTYVIKISFSKGFSLQVFINKNLFYNVQLNIFSVGVRVEATINRAYAVEYCCVTTVTKVMRLSSSFLPFRLPKYFSHSSHDSHQVFYRTKSHKNFLRHCKLAVKTSWSDYCSADQKRVAGRMCQVSCKCFQVAFLISFRRYQSQKIKGLKLIFAARRHTSFGILLYLYVKNIVQCIYMYYIYIYIYICILYNINVCI